MILQYRQAVFTLALAFLVSACATHTVKTTSYTPVVQDSQDVPEDFLLDVGVSLFDPGIDEFLGDDEDTANPEIRVAESRYAPYLLAETCSDPQTGASFASCRTAKARWMYGSMGRS